jgi:SSS family solute:Na+ symporter
VILHLAPLDYAVIVVFVVGILGLGFSAKLRDNSILSYIAAGRNLSLPAFVATLVSTWYGGILAVGDSVKAFGVGTILLNGIPYYFFALIYALFFAKRVRGAEQISIPERLELRYGRGVALVGAGFLFMLAVPSAHVLMLGTMVQLFTGWQLRLSIVVAMIGGTMFLYRGGLLADVRVGLLAFLMMYVGFFVVVGWCLTHYPLAHVLSKVDPKLLRFDGGQHVLAIVSFFILGAWTLVDPGFHQRVSSAANPELSRTGVYVSIGFWVLCDLLTTTAGLYALVMLRPDAGGLTYFPELGDKVLPPGLKALFLCGLTGTVLSAMVGYTLVSGATFGREIVSRLWPHVDEAGVKLWTRVGFFVACLTSGSILFWFLSLGKINVVTDLWYDYGGVLVGALLIPVCLAFLPKNRLRLSPKWVVSSMLLAFAVSFSWMIQGKRTNNDYLEVYLAGQKFSLGTLAPGLLASATVFGLGEVVGRRAIKNDR